MRIVVTSERKGGEMIGDYKSPPLNESTQLRKFSAFGS